MKRLCVDPGLHACGCAVFIDRQLFRAKLIGCGFKLKNSPAGWRAMGEAVWQWAGAMGIDRVVVERMAARFGDAPSRTLALHGLTGVTGAICAHVIGDLECAGYFPQEWEGSLKRDGEFDPVVERIQSRLSPEELARVELPAASLAHNVWDAIGLGLHDLGRGWVKKPG